MQAGDTYSDSKEVQCSSKFLQRDDLESVPHTDSNRLVEEKGYGWENLKNVLMTQKVLPDHYLGKIMALFFYCGSCVLIYNALQKKKGNDLERFIKFPNEDNLFHITKESIGIFQKPEGFFKKLNRKYFELLYKKTGISFFKFQKPEDFFKKLGQKHFQLLYKKFGIDLLKFPGIRAFVKNSGILSLISADDVKHLPSEMIYNDVLSQSHDVFSPEKMKAITKEQLIDKNDKFDNEFHTLSPIERILPDKLCALSEENKEFLVINNLLRLSHEQQKVLIEKILEYLPKKMQKFPPEYSNLLNFEVRRLILMKHMKELSGAQIKAFLTCLPLTFFQISDILEKNIDCINSEKFYAFTPSMRLWLLVHNNIRNDQIRLIPQEDFLSFSDTQIQSIPYEKISHFSPELIKYLLLNRAWDMNAKQLKAITIDQCRNITGEGVMNRAMLLAVFEQLSRDVQEYYLENNLMKINTHDKEPDPDN